MSRETAGLTDRSALRVEFVAKAMGAIHEVDTIHRKDCVVIFPKSSRGRERTGAGPYGLPMKETAKRFLSIAGSAMTIFLLAGMTFVVFDRDAKTAPALLFDYQSNTPTLVQVFFDVGTGFEEQ